MYNRTIKNTSSLEPTVPMLIKMVLAARVWYLFMPRPPAKCALP